MNHRQAEVEEMKHSVIDVLNAVEEVEEMKHSVIDVLKEEVEEVGKDN